MHSIWINLETLHLHNKGGETSPHTFLVPSLQSCWMKPLTLKEKEPLDGTPMDQEGLVENGLCDD